MKNKNKDCKLSSVSTGEEGEIETPVLFTIIAFIIIMMASALSLQRFAMAASLGKEAIKETTGQTNDSYIKKQTVTVTAEVPSILGMRSIYKNLGEESFTIYGNYEKGFLAISNKSKVTIFSFDKMPGEGVMIRAQEDFILCPRY